MTSREDELEPSTRSTEAAVRSPEPIEAVETGIAPSRYRRFYRNGWLAPLAVYREPRLIAILLMGFSSGLPLALTFGTLSYRLAEVGVSLTAIGLFGLVRTSYSLKFLWAPVIDRLPIPLLTARLGRRRSWALTIQAPLAMAILALGLTDPRVDPALTALAAVVVAFLSASQDIVIDAYRIELLRPEEQGAGAAATQWGYRFGMLASGAGALYAASFGDWHFAYAVMATLMGVGMVTVWLTPEPGGAPVPEALPGRTAVQRVRAWLSRAVVAENVTGGMASAAFVAYLSLLCSREFTATQYALLSSMATVGLNVLAASGGALAEALGWIPFFVLSTLFCLPSLVLLLWIMRRTPLAAQP